MLGFTYDSAEDICPTNECFCKKDVGTSDRSRAWIREVGMAIIQSWFVVQPSKIFFFFAEGRFNRKYVLHYKDNIENDFVTSKQMFLNNLFFLMGVLSTISGVTLLGYFVVDLILNNGEIQPLPYVFPGVLLLIIGLVLLKLFYIRFAYQRKIKKNTVISSLKSKRDGIATAKVAPNEEVSRSPEKICSSISADNSITSEEFQPSNKNTQERCSILNDLMRESHLEENIIQLEERLGTLKKEDRELRKSIVECTSDNAGIDIEKLQAQLNTTQDQMNGWKNDLKSKKVELSLLQQSKKVDTLQVFYI